MIKTISTLMNEEQFVVKDFGYILNHQNYQHLENLNGKELKDALLDMFGSKEFDLTYIYSNFDIIKYVSFNNEICVGAFYKLKDKFEDSSFVYEKDKELISNLVGRKDSNGLDLKLGDFVTKKNSTDIYRIIWCNSGFCLYNDYSDCIEDELDTDTALTKF